MNELSWEAYLWQLMRREAPIAISEFWIMLRMRRRHDIINHISSCFGLSRILHGLNGLLCNFHGLRVNPNPTQNQKEQLQQTMLWECVPCPSSDLCQIANANAMLATVRRGLFARDLNLMTIKFSNQTNQTRPNYLISLWNWMIKTT